MRPILDLTTSELKIYNIYYLKVGDVCIKESYEKPSQYGYGGGYQNNVGREKIDIDLSESNGIYICWCGLLYN